MGCGVQEPKGSDLGAHVPGTAIFNDDPNAAALAAYDGIDISKLKRATGKHSEIILVPQPSSKDLNDPLLWPMWKKYTFFLILVYGTFLVGAVGPLVAADQSHIASLFDTSRELFAQVLSSYFVLVLGVSTIFLQACSVKFGKRPIYLSTTILLLVSTIWASYATSIGSFTGARVLMGVGAAPLEFLVGASINDIFFVHERGVPVAIWNLALVNGINITPPIAGQILGNEKLGFRWAFRFFAIATGVLFLLQFFFMPETTFVRRPLQVELATDTSEKASTDMQEESTTFPIISKKSYLSGLNPFNGIYKTRANFFVLVLRPLLMLFTPIVFHGGLIYGLSITFLVVDAVSISVIFGSPPYSFSAQSVGLTYLGPFIASTIAMLLAGPLTDFCARILSRRNRGIFEPEFKLIPVAFYLFFGIIGFVGYGWTLQLGSKWIVPVVFFAMSNAGVVFGSTASISYVVDTNRHTTDAALGALIFWKNIWSFGLTWSLVAQIVEYGTRDVFAIVGMIIGITCLLTIPMYVFGKKVRAWMHKVRWLNFNEEDELVIAGEK